MSRLYKQPIFGMAADALRRTSAVVSRNELLPYDQRTKRRGQRASFPFASVPVKVPWGIKAGSILKPASATGILLMPLSAGGPEAEAIGRTITVYNQQPTAVPSNAIVYAIPWNNFWYSSAYICCTKTSSSSSSSTSSGCPTLACKTGCGFLPVPCLMEVNVQGLANGSLSCAALNCDFFVKHVSGCTWFVAKGVQNGSGTILPTQCTLEYGGGTFKVTVIDQFGDIAVFANSGFDCQTSTVFPLQSTSCTSSASATCLVSPQA